MSENKILSRLSEILVDHLAISEDKVTLEASLMDDLYADSLDCIELSIAIEEEFEIEEIHESVLDQFKTVNDIIKYVTEKTT
jgi:acyl carrier protein